MGMCSHAHKRTENGEFGPPGPQGSIRGLALVQGVVRQISGQDLQVVLAELLHTQHAVPGPGWDTQTKKVGWELNNHQLLGGTNTSSISTSGLHDEFYI